MARKIRVYLIDPAYKNSFDTTRAGIPLNLGYLAAYAGVTMSSECDFRIFCNSKKFLEVASKIPPDVLGVSVYYWNSQLGRWFARQAKKLNPECLVVAGGPNIDSEPESQLKTFAFFDGNCDIVIPDEGEIGFSNVLQSYLGQGIKNLFSKPIDGAVFLDNGQYVSGLMNVGLRTDLSQVPSPILSGALDEFLNDSYFPFVQTSRVCPYQCTFCVSGRSTGKLRSFSVDTVTAEVEYISRKYRDNQHSDLFLADDNFGINKQDPEIAENIRKISEKTGWPRMVGFYVDKKFTERTIKIFNSFDGMSPRGYPVPFQSMNDNTRTAIKRKNITLDAFSDIRTWADSKNLQISTELIFGLPEETKESFMEAIDFCLTHDIFPIVYNGHILPGSEMARKAYRDKYKIKTKFRATAAPNFQYINGEFIAEFEEVIISTATISYDDFLYHRKLAMISRVFSSRYYNAAFLLLVKKGFSATDLFGRIMDPDNSRFNSPGQKKFVDDYIDLVTAELFDTPGEVIEDLRLRYDKNPEGAVNTPRINTLFSARLIFEENWLADWLLQEFGGQFGDDKELFSDLITLGSVEWADPKDPEKVVEIPMKGSTAIHLGYNSNGEINEDEQYHLILESSESQKLYFESFGSEHKDNPSFYYLVVSMSGQGKSLRYDRLSIRSESAVLANFQILTGDKNQRNSLDEARFIA